MPNSPLEPEQILGSLLTPRDVVLSPDGSTFVFTLPAGQQRQLFRMPVSGGLPVQLTGGIHDFAQPAWSPDGRRLAAVSRRKLWIMDADGGALRSLAQPAGGAERPGWSPDGRHLYFSSKRRGWPQWWSQPADGQGEAVCHTPDARDFMESLDWGVGLPPRLSPDGKWLAAHSRSRENLERCEVWIFPTDGSGKGRCITPPGDVWEQYPVWSPDGKQLLIVSETPQDGWLRLQRVELEDPGRKRQPLTQGPGEDLPPLFSRDGKWMAHVRVVEGAHELFVGPSGEATQRVPMDAAYFQWIDFAPGGQSLYVLKQSPVEPPHLARIDWKTGKVEALTSTAYPCYPRAELVKPTRVRYSNREGVSIPAWLYTPHAVASGQVQSAPLIVNCHGGPHGFARFDWNEGVQLLATRGYGVLTPDYRGSTGNGRAFRRGHYGRWGEADADDLLDGALWAAKSLPWVNRTRMGIVGGSYGGYMVYCCVAREPKVFCCGAASSGDSEISQSFLHGDRPGRIDLLQTMGDPEKNKDLYRRGSPLYRAEDIEAPLLIVHSKQDRSVVVLMAELMIEALRANGKSFEAKLYDNPDTGGIGHGASTMENQLDMHRRRLKFLDTHLKGAAQKEDA